MTQDRIQNIVVTGGPQAHVKSDRLSVPAAHKRMQTHETLQHIQLALSMLMPIIRGIDDPMIHKHQDALEKISKILSNSGG
jgi:hypothetical protein